MPGEHIFLGDFNLYHPLWAGPSYPYQHTLSDTLLEHMRNAGAQLALPQSTITRDTQKGNSIEQTTIHLIFVTEELRNTISHCRVAHELIEWRKDCAAAGLPAPTEEDAHAIYLRKDVEAPDLVTIKDFFRFYVKTSTPHNPTNLLSISLLSISLLNSLSPSSPPLLYHLI